MKISRPCSAICAKQVNRPWDKVYSEIRATIDGRSTVQQHVLQHIEDYVALNTRWIETPDGGMVVCMDHYSREFVPLKDARYTLFVHPRTGILLRNRHRLLYAARRRQQREESAKRRSAVRRDISEMVQPHCLDGIWYRVELARLPPPREIVQTNNGSTRQVQKWVWDAVRKTMVSREHRKFSTSNGRPSSEEMYGRHDLYAISKRQLGSRELAEQGLQSGSPAMTAR